MKIKTKKVITEKEYLHYVIDNTDFLSISHDFIHINHDTVHSDIVLELHDLNNTTCANTWVNSKGETVFEVDIEEEITEDTHLDYLYALTNDDEKEIHRCMNFTIRNASMVIGRNDLTFFTLVDNDLVKIYENGKMVE